MTDSPLIERERSILRELIDLAARREQAATAAEADYRTSTEAADREYEDARQAGAAKHEAEQTALQTDLDKFRQEVRRRHDSERRTLDRKFSAVRRRLEADFRTARRATDAEYTQVRWDAVKEFEAAKLKGGGGKLQELLETISGRQADIQEIRREADEFAARWGREPPPRQKPAEDREAPDDPLQRLADEVTYAGRKLDRMQGALSIQLLKWYWFLLVVLAALGGAAGLAFLRPADQRALWLVGGLAAAAVGSAILYGLTYVAARAGVGKRYRLIYEALDQAEVLARRSHDRVLNRFKKQLAKLQEQFDGELRQLDGRYLRKFLDQEIRRANDLRQARQKYRAGMAQVTGKRDTTLKQAEARFDKLQAESKQRYETAARQLNEDYQRRTAGATAKRQAEWDALAAAWRDGVTRVRAGVTEINSECARLFPEWVDAAWKDWKPPEELPPAVRFGEFDVRLEAIPHGVPADERLRADVPAEFSLPALVGLPRHGSMLFKAQDRGRAQAELALQAVMFRLLTSVPPGKVRFTILDPVGLGRNFAAFMHLADYEELLVSSRIWTEHEHISQRLADMTAHMENVIQKFLRNQFQSIDEYNVQAGEVAEPFRVLVVANFPVNFSTDAARRLVSIASGGARCGVHTLISVDTSQSMPAGVALADLEPYAINFEWRGERFEWQDPDFGRFPFRLDAPPAADFTTRILQQVGQLAKLANRVEVPFDFIAPPPERWWAGDSRAGLSVPLGRSGATKRQPLVLGKGTSQHVLIAGKTGSGKSTLLHALITNLALMYSPDEVELYLIDFKEGVEFKAYAAHELPHARVVAIESEREFGLSVLQRLDAELKARGDRFRSLGVQDLNGYRETGQPALPRVLLIVDEFQLFFVEEDKVAQEAALLLDRLVRQGRAFGIHIILGSQTLGGAYSLARSTMGQMTVRIALQCTEADASLILSDENSAARLLTRPGEAIYNDANGLVEANNFFQVVWLSDEQREAYLEKVQDLMRERHYRLTRPQIVFEGKAPADVTKNFALNRLLEAPGWPAPPRSTQAWLGEAMAIKDPTAAVFRPQSGSNLMMVGPSDEAALAILSTAVIGLAAQHPPATNGPADGTRFYILDGSPADDPHAGSLQRLPGVLPHPVRVAGWRDVPAVMSELAAELDRRQKDPEATPPFVYLFIYALHRFRDLRPQEEDYGFSRRGEEKPPSPSKQFSSLLREGPGVGIFTILWCDTLTNLNRTLDRQAMREFEMRVLFQMSQSDSNSLIDSPAASRLGVHRALFHSEDRGQPEKFRPYSLPSDAWLAWVKDQTARKQAAAPIAVP